MQISITISISGCNVAPPIDELTLPASAVAAWDATALTTLSGVTQLDDMIGSNHLVFGGTAPTLATDTISGLKHLVFAKSTTTALSAASFWSNIGVTGGEDYAIIAVYRMTDRITTGSQNFIGDSSDRRMIRVRDNGYAVQTNNNSPGDGDTVDNDGYGNPAAAIQTVLTDHRCEVASHIGTARTIEGWTSDAFYGDFRLGLNLDKVTDNTANAAQPAGSFQVNKSLHGMEFYGAIYLHEPTEADVEQATAYAMRYWLAGPSRDHVFLFQGDSLSHVNGLFTDRAPGWINLIGDTIEDRAIITSFANGGRRANENTPAGINNSLFGTEILPGFIKYVEGWNRAFPGKVYCPLMIGTNDNSDSTDLSVTQSETERWATQVAAAGGKPIWLGAAFSFGTYLTDLSEDIRDRQVSGANAFVDTMDLLENDVNWQWGRNNGTAVPSLFADAVHPNTAGNADIAPKILPFFTDITG